MPWIDPFWIGADDRVLHHDYSEELLLVDDVESFIDRLDLVFTYGTLSAEQRQIIRNVFSENAFLTREKRLWIALYLVMTSPDYTILR